MSSQPSKPNGMGTGTGLGLMPADDKLPLWLRPGFLIAAVVSLLLLSLAASAAFLRLQQKDLESQALRETELYARVLADQANRTVDTVEVTIKSLAEVLQAEPNAKARGAALANAVRALPFLRSINLIDANGLLLASSNPLNRDLQLSVANLAGLPDGAAARLGSSVRIGPMLAGRDLADHDLRLRERPVSARWFIPLLMPLAAQDAQPATILVATLNPDYFANSYELSLAGTPRAAALLQLDRRLITATETIQLPSGQSAAGHLAFEAYLPTKEFGSFIAPGLDGEASINAFRSVSRAPWLVFVEQPYATVQAEFMQMLRQVGMALLAFWLVILSLAWLAWRSLQAYRVARAERRQAMLGLSEQASFTAHLLDASPAPLFVTDLAGHLLMVNRSWCEFTGLQSAAVLGRDLKDLRPELWPESGEATESANALQSFEARLPDSQGRLRDVLVHRTPFEVGEVQAGGHIGSLLDVSEYREAERRTLEAKESAEQASAMKTEFIANISHELRTPLQSIIGFSELGLTRFTEQPKVSLSFQRIHTAGQHMLVLVNNLLDLSRTDLLSARMELHCQPLLPLLQSVLTELHGLAERAGVAIHVEGKEAELTSTVDSFTFRQVLRNVLANALRFSGRDSCINVALSRSEAGGVRLLISDQGPGIPETELGRIFEPFVQSSRTKDGSGGSGLGLAICRRILDAHGGRIHAENGPAGGAVFIIELAPTLAVS